MSNPKSPKTTLVLVHMIFFTLVQASKIPVFPLDEQQLRDIVSTCNMTGNWDVLPTLQTTGITNMSRLFYNCQSMNEDISYWDVSSVVDMYEMFWGALSFDQYLGSWNVSSVENMTDIFSPPNPSTLQTRRTFDEWLPAVKKTIKQLGEIF